jgi:tetratricopeptide (TPR) repeat protein
MRRSALLLSLPLAAGLLFASPEDTHQHPPSPAPAKAVTFLPGMGSLHHPIATHNRDAQRWFDQGLTLVYGFNHAEAIRSFERAAALDRSALMPLWGIAYALGPNINMGMDDEANQKALATLEKAQALVSGAPDNERAYVEALARRYSADPGADRRKLDESFARAMGALSKQYPDDLDAATLYAEAMMDLRPWRLYDQDGKPAPGTEEIVSVLESVLRRQPDHVGANHYYIHAVEASRQPERALPSAERLQTLVPGAGHLVHMPAHIFARTGDYSAAAESNAEAAKSDDAYVRLTGAAGMYRYMYSGHNLHFLAYAAAMEGRYDVAKKAATDLMALAEPGFKEVAELEFMLPTSFLVDLRFARWDAILTAKEPPAKALTTKALWRYARGSAFAATGKLRRAESERKEFEKVAGQVPPDTPYSGTLITTSEMVLEVARHALDARIAAAGKDLEAAVDAWSEAVEAQDRLTYDEPPPWFYPVRESLGGVLLRSGKAAEAERVFREDLELNPRNPRSLSGLLESLKAQGKTTDAAWVSRQLQAAWKGTGAAPGSAAL